MASTIEFSDGPIADIEEYAVMATLSYAMPSRTSVRVALGAIVDGSLAADGRTHEIGPGVVGAASGARVWSRDAWFLAGSLGLSASRARDLTAFDLRLGALAGRNFGVVSPYVLARAFGGPVFWELDGETVVGGDAHHYQLGAGVNLGPVRGWTMVVDVAALGERGASLGIAREL